MQIVKGPVTSISFTTAAGSAFNLMLTGSPNSGVTFTSSDTTILPTPAPGTLSSLGTLTVAMTASAVTQETIVTITATFSAPPPQDGDHQGGDERNVRGPASVAISVCVQPGT